MTALVPPVVGTIEPRSDGLDARYWQALNEGALELQRCGGCSAWIWAPSWCCPECRSFDLGWGHVEPSGIIYSWTRTHQPFAAEFADQVPYITVLVELPGADNRRVLGILLGDPSDDPEIGAAVTGVFQRPGGEGSQTVLRWELAD